MPAVAKPTNSTDTAGAEDKKKKKGGFLGLALMAKKKRSDDGSTVRKTKFKKIKGFIKGDKNKKKKTEATPAPAAPATAQPANFDDDASSTIYNVDVDDRSLASVSTATRTDTSGSLLGGKNGATEPSMLQQKRFMLKVVLLLMDPSTRRFELLQLEFDSQKALVSDVLAQIPLSVTEASLRAQTFDSIVGKDGKELTRKQLLSDYCEGNEVLVAVPKGSTAKECSRLARPILGDDKVISMLKSSGIDATAWKDLRKRKSGKSRSSKAVPSVQRSTRSIKTQKSIPTIEEEPKKSSSSGMPMVAISFWLFIFALFVGAHWYTYKPIQRGERLFPGTWKSKCGLLPFDPECENEYMFVGFDGVVTGYDKDYEKIWRINGAVCGNEPGCTPGLVLTENGDVRIGDERILYVDIIEPGRDLDTGFPFATKPRIKRN